MHFYSLILHLKKIYLTNRRNINDNNNNNNNNHDGIFISNKKMTKTQRWLTAEVHPLFNAPPLQKNTLCTNHTLLSSPQPIPPFPFFFFFVFFCFE